MKKKLILKIDGMHCQSCEMITKEELGELPGVFELVVDAKTGTGELMLDDEKNSEADVLKAVEVAGYKAKIVSMIEAEPEAQTDIVISKKQAGKGEPLRVKLSVQTSAEGRVQEGENGRAYFDGVIRNDKVAEFVVPENKPEIEQLVNELSNPASMARLFDLVSSPVVASQPAQLVDPGKTRKTADT